ncbi:hypothetical protein Tco_0508023 [Tanacetum coccineum]
MGFDLVKCYLYANFIEGHTPEGVGLQVTDSFTGNHRRDDFTPLETLRRFLGVFVSRSRLSSEGRPSSRIEGLDLVNPVDLTKLFGDDERPRPLGKPRPAKKQNRIQRRAPRKAEDFIRKFVFRIQAQAGSRPIVVRDEEAKDLAIVECKKLKILTINIEGLSEAYAALINRKKEAILKKYA